MLPPMIAIIAPMTEAGPQLQTQVPAVVQAQGAVGSDLSSGFGALFEAQAEEGLAEDLMSLMAEGALLRQSVDPAATGPMVPAVTGDRGQGDDAPDGAVPIESLVADPGGMLRPALPDVSDGTESEVAQQGTGTGVAAGPVMMPYLFAGHTAFPVVGDTVEGPTRATASEPVPNASERPVPAVQEGGFVMQAGPLVAQTQRGAGSAPVAVDGSGLPRQADKGPTAGQHDQVSGNPPLTPDMVQAEGAGPSQAQLSARQAPARRDVLPEVGSVEPGERLSAFDRPWMTERAGGASQERMVMTHPYGPEPDRAGYAGPGVIQSDAFQDPAPARPPGRDMIQLQDKPLPKAALQDRSTPGSVAVPTQGDGAVVKAAETTDVSAVEDQLSVASLPPSEADHTMPEAPSARAPHGAPLSLGPTTMNRLAAQIADMARPLANGTVDVSLQPEELGRLRLSFGHEAGQMTVAVAADRPETLDLMRRNIDSLAQDLRDLGFGDVSFSFADPRPGQQGQPGQVGETLTDTAPVETMEPQPDPPRVSWPAPPLTGAGMDIRL